jgi:putative phage-type endonuclease
MSLSIEQMEFRRTGIGASESPCLIGVSPFGSPISVWAEKMGLSIDEPTMAMNVGNFLEDGLARLYAHETKRTVAHFGSIRHPKYPWMICTPDLCVFGERRIAQIKMVGMWMVHHWEEGVPDYVEVQVQHEMEVTDADVCDVVALLGGTDFRIIPIERDRSMGADLVEVCGDFYKRHVLTGEMPEVDGSEAATLALRERFRQRRTTFLPATDEAEAWGRKWLDADERMATGSADRELAAQKLKTLIGENEGIEGECFRATWKANKNGVRSFKVKELGRAKEEAA